MKIRPVQNNKDYNESFKDDTVNSHAFGDFHHSKVVLNSEVNWIEKIMTIFNTQYTVYTSQMINKMTSYKEPLIEEVLPWTMSQTVSWYERDFVWSGNVLHLNRINEIIFNKLVASIFYLKSMPLRQPYVFQVRTTVSKIIFMTSPFGIVTS